MDAEADRMNALYWLRNYLYYWMTTYKEYNIDMKSKAQIIKIVADGIEWLNKNSCHAHTEDFESQLTEISSGIDAILYGNTKIDEHV